MRLFLQNADKTLEMKRGGRLEYVSLEKHLKSNQLMEKDSKGNLQKVGEHFIWNLDE